MTSIKLIVNGAKARAEVHGVLTSGTVEIPVEIEYDSAWRGLNKTLLCTSGKLGPAKNACAILNANGYSTVAQEALIADNRLYVGVEGRNADGTLVIATTWAQIAALFFPAPAWMQRLLQKRSSLFGRSCRRRSNN